LATPVLILAGYMGGGKTSVGRAAAALLGWPFVDLDDEIERSVKGSISEVFANKGEGHFRALEMNALSSVLKEGARSEGLVLALGGGTLTNPEAVQLAKNVGVVIYLQLDAETAWERVVSTDRPLAKDEAKFKELLAQRVEIYEKAADVVVDARRMTIEELAEAVAGVGREIIRDAK
jgi:shikimate kinase